ncbi:hypothetical protein HDU97_004514 [Phlyctochytrium planicorne]|nr:hypothetical protein HDU97_004514 [Phlyctochytrium planicorne]
MIHRFPLEIKTCILLWTRDAIASIRTEIVLVCHDYGIESPTSIPPSISIDHFPASATLTKTHFLPFTGILQAEPAVLLWFIRYRRALVSNSLWELSAGFASKGSLEGLYMLLDNGFEVPCGLLFKHALQGRHANVINGLVDRGFQGWRDMALWMQRGFPKSLDVVQFALTHYGDRGIASDLLLFNACGHKASVEFVRYLLDMERWQCISKCIQFAVVSRNFDVVPLLMEAESMGRLPRDVVDAAIKCAPREMVKLFVERGDDCNVKLLVELVNKLAEKAARMMVDQQVSSCIEQLNQIYKEHWEVMVERTATIRELSDAVLNGSIHSIKTLASISNGDILESLLLQALNAGDFKTANHLIDAYNQCRPNWSSQFFGKIDQTMLAQVYVSSNLPNYLKAMHAVYNNRIDLLRLMHETEPGSIPGSALIYCNGSLGVIKFMIDEVGMPCTPALMDACTVNMQALRYLYSRFHVPCTQRSMINPIPSWRDDRDLPRLRYLHKAMKLPCDEKLLEKVAASQGRNLFLYAFENRSGNITESVWKSTIVGSHCDRLSFLIDKLGSRPIPSEWLDRTFFECSGGAAITMLKFLASRNLTTFTNATLASASTGGSLESVKYLHEEFGLTHDSFYECNRPNPDLIQYLHDQLKVPILYPPRSRIGLDFDEETLRCISSRLGPVPPCILFDTTGVSTDLGTMGKLKFMVEEKILSDINGAVIAAASLGKMDVVEYLHGVGGGESLKGAMDVVAEKGYLSIVRFLHEKGGDCTRKAIDEAAKKGFVDVVYFLLANRREGFSPELVDVDGLNPVIKEMLLCMIL